MRITIVNQFYRPDIAPTAHLAASLAEHRAALGDRVTIIAAHGAYTELGPRVRDRAADNPRVHRVWTPGLGKANHFRRVLDYLFFYLFAAFKLLTLPRQDLIITLTTPPLISWCALLHKRLHSRRTRLILWNMDCYPEMAERGGVMQPGGLAAAFCHARNRAVFRNLDHLVCLDEAMARLLCGRNARVNPLLPVTIVPNWEDSGFFPPGATREPWEGRARLNLEGRFIALYLGNMGYGHDFDTLLSAAELLRDDPATFLFVGGGRHWQAVTDAAKRRNLDNVVMHGYVTKETTPEVMRGADCALVTLRDDALGIMSPSKIHSNLAMGLPLVYVGPETSNVDEAIRHFGCGISLRHGQSRELADFIRSLLNDRERRNELKRRARDAFEQAYCDRATLPRLDAVISHAVNGAAGAPGVPAGTAATFAAASPRAGAPPT